MVTNPIYLKFWIRINNIRAHHNKHELKDKSLSLNSVKWLEITNFSFKYITTLKVKEAHIFFNSYP